MYGCNALRVQKRALGPLELGLQVIVSMGAGNHFFLNQVLLCRLVSQRSAWFCLPNAGMKVVYHAWLFVSVFVLFVLVWFGLIWFGFGLFYFAFRDKVSLCSKQP